MEKKYNGRIMIIDDSASDLAIITKMLENNDYQVRTALNGQAALQVLPEFLPDLILLDVVMPGLSGVELLKAVKANAEWAQIPIMFITGKAEQAEVCQGFENGVVDYIVKPFAQQELLNRMKRQLKLREMSQELDNIADKNRESQIVIGQRERQIMQMESQMKQLAASDSFTGLYNRQNIYLALKREISRLARTREQLSVIFIKWLNYNTIVNNFGEADLNMILTIISGVLLKNFREYDAIARWSDDEFLIMLPLAGSAEAKLMELRLDNVLGNIKIELAGSTAAIEFASCHLEYCNGNVDKFIKQLEEAISLRF